MQNFGGQTKSVMVFLKMAYCSVVATVAEEQDLKYWNMVRERKPTVILTYSLYSNTIPQKKFESILKTHPTQDPKTICGFAQGQTFLPKKECVTKPQKTSEWDAAEDQAN